MRKVSAKTKKLRGYGSGEGAEYKPYIHIREKNSIGTAVMMTDWKTGRQVHLLSQAERKVYLLLRWDDNNIDIREQYPLDMKLVSEVAASVGYYVNPYNKEYVWTTDMLVTRKDGTYCAYSVKYNRDVKDNAVIRNYIEQLYWEHLGYDFKLCYGVDINEIMWKNIMVVTEFYDKTRVYDVYSAFKHKVARKEIVIDMGKVLLTNDVISKYLEVIDDLSKDWKYIE